MLARIRKSVEEKDAGFTLVELLVVMIIIGILAAIAIPVFLNQRTRAVDTSIKSDLRAVAQEIETYYVDNQKYPAVADSSAVIANVKLSTGNVVAMTKVTTTGYCLQGSNPASNAKGGSYFWVDSGKGGLQTGAPTATVTGAVACA